MNILNPIVAVARHYPPNFIRHFVWWLRLGRADVGQNVSFHLPVRISGNGKLRFGSGCRIGRNVSFAVSSGSMTDFKNGCSIGDGSNLTFSPNSKATFTETVSIYANCQLAVVNEWTVGSGSIIESSCMISAREPRSKGNLNIGRGSFIGDYAIIDTTGGVSIGDEVAIGPYCIIYTHDHEPATNDGAVWKGNPKAAAIKIGNRAWIGARVTILPGVNIGERAIIGAGAVVTREIPAHSLAVGVPAKVIKKLPLNFSEFGKI